MSPASGTPDAGSDWACEAYGPEGRKAGALCFTAEPGERACTSPKDCHQATTAARHRIFARIQELAADGDETGIYLAGEFERPEQLLGGEDPAPGDEPAP